MFAKYLLIFFVSMVPLVELRGGIVMAVGMDLDYWTSLAVCVVGQYAAGAADLFLRPEGAALGRG